MDKQKPNLVSFLEEVVYTIGQGPKNCLPGRWISPGSGSSFSFEKLDKLSNHPDFRRIDPLATKSNVLTDDFLVRIFRPEVSVDVIILADLSLSMLYSFVEPKLWQLAKLATLFGYTAYRYGDKFGFLAANKDVAEDLFVPPAKHKALGLEIGKRLLDYFPDNDLSDGLLRAADYLPRRRSFIILVSDFYFSSSLLEKILSVLRCHEVLPVVLRQRIERKWEEGAFGFIGFSDFVGQKRNFFLTRKNIRRFNRKVEAEEKKLLKIFSNFFCHHPLVLEDIVPAEIFFRLGKGD